MPRLLYDSPVQTASGCGIKPTFLRLGVFGMKSVVVFLRTVLFHLAVFLFTAVYSSLSIGLIFLLPYEARFRYLTIYSRTIIYLAKVICGIGYRVEGLENFHQQRAFVVLAKHQSQWETFFLVNLLFPVAIVCKKELLKLPMGVGVGIGSLKPIAVDRSDPKQALKDISTQGRQRLLEDNMPVLLFPEGTRTAPGERRKYARSGAALAIAAGVPAVFVSHNAGYFWPATTLLKYPGTVVVRISPPVDTAGKTATQLTDMAAEWIEPRVADPAQEP